MSDIMLTGNKNKSIGPKRAKLVSTALIILVSASFGFLGGWAGSRSNNLNFTGDGDTRQQIISTESELINDIAKNVGPSVVSISVVSQTNVRDFFGIDRAFEQEAAGTGPEGMGAAAPPGRLKLSDR